jgi:hypothetical protein
MSDEFIYDLSMALQTPKYKTKQHNPLCSLYKIATKWHSFSAVKQPCFFVFRRPIDFRRFPNLGTKQHGLEQSRAARWSDAGACGGDSGGRWSDEGISQ